MRVLNNLKLKTALKFGHALGAVGIAGAFAAHMILLDMTPELTRGVAPSADVLNDYALMRTAIGRIADWLMFPSLALVLVSGMASMGVYKPFHEAGWVWMKALLGISMFEGTLVAVLGPAQRAADKAQAAVAGELDPAMLAVGHDEWGALWVMSAVAVANIVLGVWRPRFYRSKFASKSSRVEA